MPNQLPNNALYLVTESNLARGRPNSYMVSKAIEGGATIVQLREKEWTKEQYAEEARIIAGICKEHSVFFVVNDYPDIARDVGADGLHLGQEDMPLSQARRIYSGVIGKSTHSREQALAAVVEGADYISIGPVFPTRKKPNPVGLQLVREMAPKLPIPFVAIGGIKLHNAEKVLEAGATRIAVISALVEADDVERAAQDFIMIIRRDAEWK